MKLGKRGYLHAPGRGGVSVADTKRDGIQGMAIGRALQRHTPTMRGQNGLLRTWSAVRINGWVGNARHAHICSRCQGGMRAAQQRLARQATAADASKRHAPSLLPCYAAHLAPAASKSGQPRVVPAVAAAALTPADVKLADWAAEALPALFTAATSSRGGRLAHAAAMDLVMRSTRSRAALTSAFSCSYSHRLMVSHTGGGCTQQGPGAQGQARG